MNEQKIVSDIIEVGRRCWQRGWVAANDGNISVRISENEILATVTGVSKGFLTPEMIVKVDPEGDLIEGSLKPSSEIQMHLLVYKKRPDIYAVFHAHPPFCTAHAVAGLSLSECVLPEIVVTLGQIPLAKYGTPSTPEIPQSLLPYIENHDAFLLQNHGALTLGKDVYEAYYRMESIEHFAHILYLARGLGSVNMLEKSQVEKLQAIRSRYGFTGNVPLCTYREKSESDSDPFKISNLIKSSANSESDKQAPRVREDELVEIITDRIIDKLKNSRRKE